MNLKVEALDVPCGIVAAFQAEIDRGWDGVFDLDGKPRLVMGLEIDPSGVGTVTFARLAKGKVAR